MHLHPQRERRAAARRRRLPVRARATATWPRRTTTTRSSASASSPARRARAPTTCRSTRPGSGSRTGRSSSGSTPPASGHNLFAYPAQSNFSGVKHPLGWIATAQERGWDVLLDCAAFAPTNRLDLAVWKPDFVALSFYKMFGYPTGIGACSRAARRSPGSAARGSAAGPSSPPGSGPSSSSRWPGHARFEDGTVDYLGIPAVEIGLRRLRRIGVDIVAQRVRGARILAARRAARPPARRREPGDAHLRPGDMGPPRRHGRVQLPRSRRPRRRRAPRRPGRRGAPHLAPDRLLLQPGRR